MPSRCSYFRPGQSSRGGISSHSRGRLARGIELLESWSMASKRLAVVTGANRGIGHAIAKRLALSGFDVVGTARDAAEGRKTMDEIGARFAPLDVTDRSSIGALAAQLEGGLDVLVNNAGVSLRGFD